MDASARVVVRPGPERTAVEVASSSPPFSIRRSGSRILVAASAAGPVGGDHLRLDVVVRAGAVADIGSVGAVSVHPGPHGDASSLSSSVTVGEDAELFWWPEPTLSIGGSDHTTTTTVSMAASSRCVLVEEVSLGRTGECSGRLGLTVSVVRGGRPLVRHTERFGPDRSSLVTTGDARHVLSAVVVGVDAGASRTEVAAGCRAAWLPVADDAAVLLAVGADRPAVRRIIEQVAPEPFARRLHPRR